MGRRPRRRGGAAVELALLLPFLAVMLLGSLDLCRLFYTYTILADCAHNGAAYGADAASQPSSPYYVAGNWTLGVQNAALADAANLSPAPTVTSINAGSVVVVQVSCPFQMLSSYLVAGPITISRKIQMAVAPTP